MRRVLLAVGFIALTGCGGDSGPTTAIIAGTWSYSVSNLVGGGVTCNGSGTNLVLNQSGATFSGSYSGGTLTCSAPGVAPQSVSIGSGIIVNGNVGVTNVSFDLDTSDWTNTGTISGSSMSGNAVVTINDGSTITTLTGHFAAARN